MKLVVNLYRQLTGLRLELFLVMMWLQAEAAFTHCAMQTAA